MKLINCLTTSLLLLLLSIGSLEANRLLAVLLPYDALAATGGGGGGGGAGNGGGGGGQRPIQNNWRSIASRSRRALVDHHFYMDRRSIQNCAVQAEDEPTFLAMDRLCEACHEMYRHTDPNLRANCRSNCFDNDDFVFCFNHFAGVEVTRGGGKR